MTIDEAIGALEAATDGPKGVTQQTEAVRIALRALLAARVEKETLIWFWQSAGQENDIGRSQNMRASLNRIRLLLR